MSRFDQKLAAGEGVVGTFSHLGGPAVAECLSLSGLDYVIIDTEHGPFPDESTGEMIRAIELHSAEAFVRVRDSSRAAVLHALDPGRGASSSPTCNRWKKHAGWWNTRNITLWERADSLFRGARNTGSCPS
ncbi:MAG: hypothetical protein ACLR2P_14950 [Bilophila wadsworthia]